MSARARGLIELRVHIDRSCTEFKLMILTVIAPQFCARLVRVETEADLPLRNRRMCCFTSAAKRTHVKLNMRPINNNTFTQTAKADGRKAWDSGAGGMEMEVQLKMEVPLERAWERAACCCCMSCTRCLI